MLDDSRESSSLYVAACCEIKCPRLGRSRALPIPKRRIRWVPLPACPSVLFLASSSCRVRASTHHEQRTCGLPEYRSAIAVHRSSHYSCVDGFSTGMVRASTHPTRALFPSSFNTPCLIFDIQSSRLGRSLALPTPVSNAIADERSVP